MKSLLTIIIGRNRFFSPGTGAAIPMAQDVFKAKERRYGTSEQSEISWQELYQAALVEPDQQKLTELVMAVEEAMFLRAGELTASKADDKERTAMAEASRNLLIIKTDKLGWPGIKSK